MGQPYIKQYNVEFSRTGKLNPCTMSEQKLWKMFGTFFIHNVMERVKNIVLKLVQ